VGRVNVDLSECIQEPVHRNNHINKAILTFDRIVKRMTLIFTTQCNNPPSLFAQFDFIAFWTLCLPKDILAELTDYYMYDAD
jgi:hypothetical protein